jgi:hypothetical protein
MPRSRLSSTAGLGSRDIPHRSRSSGGSGPGPPRSLAIRGTYCRACCSASSFARSAAVAPRSSASALRFAASFARPACQVASPPARQPASATAAPAQAAATSPATMYQRLYRPRFVAAVKASVSIRLTTSVATSSARSVLCQGECRSAVCGLTLAPHRSKVSSVGVSAPPGRAGLRDPEAPCDLSDRLIALPGDRDRVAPELHRNRLGHDADPSSEAAASQVRRQPEPWTVPSAVARVGQSPYRAEGRAEKKWGHVFSELTPGHRAAYTTSPSSRAPRISVMTVSSPPSEAGCHPFIPDDR